MSREINNRSFIDLVLMPLNKSIALGILLTVVIGVLATGAYSNYTIKAQNENIVSISITSNPPYYLPSQANSPVGAMVQWTNEDNKVHAITSITPVNGPLVTFNSGDIPAHGKFTFRFTTPGVFGYYDPKFPYMTGTITVS